jgi:two-component system phosphate regulon response regulator PhoB
MYGSILVVEDDASIRELLCGNLSNAGYRVACAADVAGAEAAMREMRPDLALLDWMLPGTSGLTFARQLRTDQRTAEISIIVVSGRSAEQDRVAALESGADDYVTKPFSMRELLARIKAVLRRRAPQRADEIVEIAGLRFDPAARRVSAGDEDIELWATEYRLLHFFMTHPERVFSRAKLLDEVWGDHVFVEERTVDVHIRRLRQALAATGHGDLIETVRGVGYRFRSELPRRTAAPVEHARSRLAAPAHAAAL